MYDSNKGELVGTIEPTGNIRFKVNYLRVLPFLLIIPVVYPIVALWILTNFPLWFILMVASIVAIMSFFSYLVGYHAFSKFIKPIRVFTNGIEAFSSPFYSLKGLSGFTPKEKISEVRIMKAFATTDLRSAKVGGNKKTLVNWLLTLKTVDGKSRILGYRETEAAERAALMIYEALGIPFFYERDEKINAVLEEV